jgi:hypothetical protein
MSNPIRRRALFSALSLAGSSLALVVAKAASASQKKTYKYRCTKCKLIQEYSVPGVKKCPNDGTTMIRMSS